MTLTTKILAQGPGWRVSDVLCTAGPADPVVEEQHDEVCVAVVLDGTFGYRSARGKAALAPGAALLGNPGDGFACGHEHSAGDRCLSCHFEPHWYEEVAACVPGVRRLSFTAPSLAPSSAMARLGVMAEADLGDPAALYEIAVEIAGTAAAGAVAVHRTPDAPAGFGSWWPSSMRISRMCYPSTPLPDRRP